MSTIQSINPSKWVPLVEQSCATKEELRATSTDCSDREPTVEKSDLAANYLRLLGDAYQKNGDNKEAANLHKLAANAYRKAIHYYQSAAHSYLRNGNNIETDDCYRLAADVYRKCAFKGGS